MALKTLNSVGGFSVSDINGNATIIIDSDGNVTTPSITVSGVSNLGSNANVKITGGTTGQVLSTDGAGNLSWSTGGGSSTGFIQVFLRAGGTSNITVYSGTLQIVGRSGNIPILVS
jgi:hypothetical protein